MKDYRRICDNLTDLFISVEYGRAAPVNLFNCTARDITGMKGRAIDMYRNDNLFRYRVDSLVSQVMTIIRDKP